MPKMEKDIEDRFFDILIDQKDGFSGTPINVYQKLVYTRYEEVIKNSLPLFIDKITQSELQESIIKFMKDTPKTPFVWQIPNDFRKFTKKKRLFHDRKYLYDLMYYDWIEIELYMKEYKLKPQKKFRYKESYKLSKTARVKKFNFDIIGNDYKSKRENYLVIYYDFDMDDIIYREINPLIYYVLKTLNKKKSFEKVIKELCKVNDIDYKEAKTVLKNPFLELYKKRVFS